MTSLGPISETILNRAPKFLRGPNIGRFLQAAGLVLDTNLQTLAEGLKLSNPLKCDVSAFPSLSLDRGIPLYETEPEASKRYRLSIWHQIRRHDASAYGKFINAQPYFLGTDGNGVIPRMRIVHTNGALTACTWHTMTGSYDDGGAGVYSVHRNTLPNWNFDNLAYWSRWWAIIYTHGTVLDDVTFWDDGNLWDGGQYWDGASGAVLNDIVSLFKDRGAPHAQCAGVILARDIDSFDPTGVPANVGDGTTTLPDAAGLGISWGALVNPSTNLPTRLQTATWIFDRYYTNL